MSFIDGGDLGRWLADEQIPADERNRQCLDFIREQREGASYGQIKIGKSACHLAYRSLEGKVTIPGIEEMLEFCENDLARRDRNSEHWQTVRWIGSIRIARLYLHIRNQDSLEWLYQICSDLFQPDWMSRNPTGAVNCCRAQCLGMAIAARLKRPDLARESLSSCQQLIALAAPEWRTEGEAYCGGWEFVQTARSFSTCFALMPYAGLGYQGDVVDIKTVIDTQDYPLMREALATLTTGLEMP